MQSQHNSTPPPRPSPPPASAVEGEKGVTTDDLDAVSPTHTLWDAPSPTQTLGHSSPELPPLPALPPLGGAPHTPSTLLKRPLEDSSFFTASWGSPYQHPSPDDKHKSSPQKDGSPYSGDSLGDDLEDPLGSPRFGLEHLIPTRLEEDSDEREDKGDSEPKFKFDLSHLLPARLRSSSQSPSTPSRSTTPSWLDTLAEKTPKPPSIPKPGPLFFPREPTENWVKQYLTGQWQSEKGNWWSEGSTEEESDESLGETSQARTFKTKDKDKKRKSRKGHKLREDNLTLKQQDFWAHFGEKSKEQISKMLASRFAEPVPTSSPAPVQEPQLPLPADVIADAKSPSPLDKDKPLPMPPPTNVSNQKVPSPSSSNLLAPPKVVDTAKAAIARNKKRVLWRGRNIVIQIPPDPTRGKEGGPPRPLSWDEVGERIKGFEQQGLNTQGFDTGVDDDGLPAQAVPLFPDPAETQQEMANKDYHVHVPNRAEWEAYVNFLTEQKLAALGVSTGMDDPVADMSRQGSAQYHGLALSPPPQTSSAASTGIAGLPGPFALPAGPSPGIPGHMTRASIASPISPFGNPRPTMHLHRASTFTSAPNFPQQQPTPPGMPGWSPHTFISQNGDIRGASPALPTSRSDLVNMMSPISPFGAKQGQQQFPFPQTTDGFTQMHQQQQALQQQLLQQQQQQLLNARPNSTLAQLPEEDVEEEQPRLHTPPRSNSRPNIVVPTPRGHRHNISENLEREIRNAEYHLEQAIDRQLDEDGEFGTGNRFGMHSPPSKPTMVNGHDTMWQNNQNGQNGFQHQSNTSNQSASNSQHYGAPSYHQHEVEDDQKTNISDVDTNPSIDGQNDQASEHHSYGSSQLNKTGTGTAHSSQGSKSSAGKFNVEAKEFKFNPGASFTPETFSYGSNFQAQQPAQQEQEQAPPRSSSGKTVFHATAPSFAPSWKLGGLGVQNGAAPLQVPQTSFNFSAEMPAANYDVPMDQEIVEVEEQQPPETPNKIFNGIHITGEDIVKPARRSKAVPIQQPEHKPHEEEETFDEFGRLDQAEWRQKRARHRDDENDNVPKFATPHILPSNAPPQALGPTTRRGTISHKRATSPRPNGTENQLPPRSKQGTPAPQPMKVEMPKHIEMPPMPSDAEGDRAGRKRRVSNSSVSGPVKPFDYTPSAGLGLHVTKPSTDAHAEPQMQQDMRQLSRSPANTYQPSEGGSFMTALENGKTVPYPESDGPDYTFHQPTFDEIDDVMRTMAEGGSECGIEKNHSPVWERTSPLRRPRAELRPTNLNNEYKRTTPSPDEHRLYASAAKGDVSSLQDPFSDSRAGLAYESPVHNLNGPNGGQVSDWNDVITSDEEGKIKSRSRFFDNHVDTLIDNVLQSRLGPLERNMHMIKDSITALTQGQHQRSRHTRLSMSADGESDADDEDDDLASNHRGRSPVKDRKMEKIKSVITEALAAHQPPQPVASGSGPTPAASPGLDIAEFYQALADLKISIARSATTSQHDDFRELMEEALARQSKALVQQNEAAAAREAHARIMELQGKLEETEQRVEATLQSRKIAEIEEKDAQRKLALLDEELALVRAQGRDDAARARALSEEGHDTRMKLNAAVSAQEELHRRLVALGTQNEALEATLNEYRMSSKKWHDEISRARVDKEVLTKTITTLEARNQESLQVREQMREKLEKLQRDMVHATTHVEEEKQSWQRREEEGLKRNEVLRARLEAEARTRERIEREMERLEMQEREMMRMKVILDQTQRANASMEEMVNKQRVEIVEYQKRSARFEREFHEAKEVARSEIKRMRVLMEADIDAANSQVNIVRAELEAANNRLRADIDNVKMEADTAKERHELLLESEADAKHDALREAHEGRDRALREQQHSFQRYEKTIEELHRQANRDVANAVDDKTRIETQLHDRLALSEEKVEYLQDKIAHLEDKLEVAKSAAHAAAAAAQSAKSPAPVEHVQPSAQEKVSPQALRESIVVLQEQLQEREQRIESLDQQLSELDTDAPSKLKERDTEIGWLRELLGVRVDDISELIDALAQPAFDREAVRDAAIRIRTNLQMEQHEKERLISGAPQTFPSIASISSFATPKAAQLAAAFGNWRKGNNNNGASKLDMSRSASNDGGQAAAYKGNSHMAPGFLSGLMTPPATAMRRTPSQQSHLSTRSNPNPQGAGGRGSFSSGLLNVTFQRQPATPPLLRRTAYDQDPEDVDVDAHAQEFRALGHGLRAAGFFDDDGSVYGGSTYGGSTYGGSNYGGDGRPVSSRKERRGSSGDGHIRRTSLTVDDEALRPFEPFGPIMED
ncbi:uncharacterized protein K452DRAFT_264928 [Aplosporella prunicola CBS 121167]|uniref:Uncharacterized protein n=1 Tax=Aplosporella prunicola CBS 121167 TaxID=1176127 RepID=A0A6A6BS88_9PEZI|nr:uncharacterized protein K452DRAFT_264928 [Aplosporella prunicola CBS 121167]KAF2145687.1 hypothetical protein K452DRAFT_264928 [Aplosporella prunicola CBS 121167]